MELAVSELVTTAVEHAHGEPVTVVVALTADPPTAAISVRSVRIGPYADDNHRFIDVR